jgi:prepilin signal peptidase PulO-like enzyme (type II secretory pathway)
MNEEKSENKMRWGLIGLFFLIGTILTLTAPIWQGIVLGLYILIVPVILIVAGAIAFIASPNISVSGLGSLSVLIGAIFLVFSSPLSDSTLIGDIVPVELGKLPATTDVRYLPIEVANSITTGTLNDPMYVPGKHTHSTIKAN